MGGVGIWKLGFYSYQWWIINCYSLLLFNFFHTHLVFDCAGGDHRIMCEEHGYQRSGKKCKEKEKYDWCASKENNIDVAWKIAGEPGHGGVYNHTQPQCLVNDVRHSPGLSCRRAPPPRDGRWWLLRWLASVVLHVPLRPHPVDVPRAQTMTKTTFSTNQKNTNKKEFCSKKPVGFTPNSVVIC